MSATKLNRKGDGRMGFDFDNGLFTGESVLVRDDPSIYGTAQRWEYSIYAYYDYDENKYITINGDEWDQCIQYEGNEKFLGTCDDPYEE